MARLFVVLADGKIPELGGIRGPITKPSAIAISTVIDMVNRGLPVEEVNPANYEDRVKMTFGNIHNHNFVSAPKKAPVETPATPAAQTIPAGRSNAVVEPVNEAKAAKETRDNKSWKNNKKEVTPINKSDF